MTGQAFRFIHASDFHLEQPLQGLVEVPDHLNELLIDAPYTAAQRVFDAAIRDHVDFVLLSGDLVDPDLSGPRGVGFLLEQFERLDREGIAIYWAGGKVDPPQSWPIAARLPSSVQVFPAMKAEELTHFRGDQPVANIVGRSWQGATLQPSDFPIDSEKMFTIAVSHGQADGERLTQRDINYWALGGEHGRKTIGNHLRMMHYPGSPQGRSPEEAGPHGCTLVHVSSDGSSRAEFLPTDAIRWQAETLLLDENNSRSDLKKMLAERMKKLAVDATDRPILLNWIVRGGETLGLAKQRQAVCAELVQWLREDFGHGRVPVWTLGLDTDFEDSLPAEWYAEDSMLGDYLRALGEQVQPEAVPYDLAGYLSDRQKTAGLGWLSEWNEKATRRRVLREAAVLGAELLGADEPETVA